MCCQSGWLLGEALVAGKPTMVSVDHGKESGSGRFRVHHRDQMHGTHRLLFKALQK